MKYVLFCNYCGQKHFTDGSDISGLVEVKTAPLPKNANGVDKSIQELPRKFKCYNCGMLFKIVKLAAPKNEVKETKQDDAEMGENYLKQWENECLRSARKKKGSQ